MDETIDKIIEDLKQQLLLGREHTNDMTLDIYLQIPKKITMEMYYYNILPRLYREMLKEGINFHFDNYGEFKTAWESHLKSDDFESPFKYTCQVSHVEIQDDSPLPEKKHCQII